MNKRQRRLTNEGFSLIELIVVIAIMAILVGVMAPQVTKYIKKAQINSDKQQADAIRTAVITALVDDTVTNPSTFAAGGYSIKADAAPSDGTGENLWITVAQSLGYSTAADLSQIITGKKFKSGNVTEIKVTITDSNGNYGVAVKAVGSDNGASPKADIEIK